MLHYEGGGPSRRSFCLFWRETKQRPELEIFDTTGSGQGNASQSVWKKELREGSWQMVTQRGSRQRSAEGSSEGRPVRDELAFLVACRSFAKTTRQR